MVDSIFDKYVTIKNPFNDFDWEKIDEGTNLGDDEIISEGELQDFDFDNEVFLGPFYYVATKDKIIKCQVRSRNNHLVQRKANSFKYAKAILSSIRDYGIVTS